MEIKNKKFFKALAIVLAVIAFFILLSSVLQKKASGAWLMRDWDGQRGSMVYAGASDNYVFPYDADKTGKLAIKVGNLETATQGIKDVAAAQGGEVVFYEINSATSRVRNGIVVVKVAKDKFEQTFAELKKQAALVVQESITKGQDFPQAYPMMGGVAEAKPINVESVVGEEVAIAPAPLLYPTVKEKEFSYIKVIFVSEGRENEKLIVSGLKNASKIILVVVVIKIILTLLLFAFLVYLIMYFLRHTASCRLCRHGQNCEAKKEVKKEVQAKPLRKISRVAVKKRTVVVRNRSKK